MFKLFLDEDRITQEVVDQMHSWRHLCCPKCGAQMKVIAFIEKQDQPDVVERILRHCGLWGRPATRDPPAESGLEQLVLELQYVDADEFLMAL